MEKGKFVFIVFLGIAFVIAFIAIFTRNSHLCYANICNMKLDYF